MIMTNTRRRPWLALTASLALPGLGQMYNGQIYKGVWLFALLALALPASAWLAIHAPGGALAPVVVVGVLAALAIYLLAVIDAYRTAASLGAAYVPNSYNQGHAYLALFLCGYFFVLAPSVQRTKTTLLELFVVPTSSMVPALLPGDRFFADKNVNKPGGGAVSRGDIAVFTYPNNRVFTYVKRVIALPGDHVEMRGTDLTVNGLALGRPANAEATEAPGATQDQVAVSERGDHDSYVVLWNRTATHRDLTIDVPPGFVFVLGDNRDATQDSRQFGLVPLADIVGIARQILVSARGGEMRWGRIGRVLH